MREILPARGGGTLHRTAGIYLAAQAAAVLAWWALLLAHPPARVHFQLGESESALLAAALLPDPAALFREARSAGAGYNL